MSKIERVEADLRTSPRRWLVTGAAGFIGSHLVERLLELGQDVVGLDNFLTGSRRNLDEVTGRARGGRFEFIDGDIRDPQTCHRASEGVEVVLHQAALGSVPRSIEDPVTTHAINVDGTLNMFIAARDAGVRRVVYASSSSVYGDDPVLPRREGRIGRQLSPYAASKRAGEIYAAVFRHAYGLSTIGLRYFNVFGPRQDPDGPYAAVIPRWVRSLLRDQPCVIFGDGETSRDFCYVANVIQANLLAAMSMSAVEDALYNIGAGGRTTLNELFDHLRVRAAILRPGAINAEKVYRDFRPGDVRDSHANIRLALRVLGYRPTHDVAAGLDAAVGWYAEHLA